MSPAQADLAAVQTFSIAPQSLSAALIQFSKQADVQVVGDTKTLENLSSVGVSGSFTGREALRKLLERQPVVFEEVTARSVRILPQKSASTAADAAASSADDEPGMTLAQSQSSPSTAAAAERDAG